MAERFFSILKTKRVYQHKAETFSQANKMIDCCLYFYDYARIRLACKRS